jgi:ribosomal-protein-alanine N-acetyltransferase
MLEIETARLRLRMPVAADIDDYYHYIHSDPDVMRYLPGGVPRARERTATTLALVIEHWHRYGFGLWSVEPREKTGMIGHCGLSRVPEADGVVELAYAFGKRFWGHGLASEAAKACLRFGFEHLGLPEIIAVAVPENMGSQRVMQKIAMQYQGVTDRFYGAKLVLYSIRREDCLPGDDVYVLHLDS